MNRFFDKAGSKENPPRMIHEEYGKWYMTTRPQIWENRSHGYNAGDCMWWTALAAITYPKNKKFLEGVKELAPFDGRKWRRHPFGEFLENTKHPVDEFTRDHFILAISAMALLDYPSAVEAIKKTKFRISKATISRIELEMWKNAIRNKDNFYGKMWAKYFTTGFVLRKGLNLIWSKVVQNMLQPKSKQVHPNDWTGEVGFNTGAARFVDKWLRPKAYPNHLAAWKLYILKEMGLGKSPISCSILRATAGRNNYLISLLTGKKINKSLIKDYDKREGWIWQTYIDSTQGRGVKVTEEEGKYNAMDKDLLTLLYNKL